MMVRQGGEMITRHRQGQIGSRAEERQLSQTRRAEYWQELKDGEKRIFLNTETQEQRLSLPPEVPYMPFSERESPLMRFLRSDEVESDLKPVAPWKVWSYWGLAVVCFGWLGWNWYQVKVVDPLREQETLRLFEENKKLKEDLRRQRRERKLNNDSSSQSSSSGLSAA